MSISIARYLRRDVRNIPAISLMFRISVILVELGATAIGFLVTLARLDRRSGLGELPKADDYIGWLLLADISIAIAYALFFERWRWIRNVSLAFHVALVAVIIGVVVGFYYNPND